MAVPREFVRIPSKEFDGPVNSIFPKKPPRCCKICSCCECCGCCIPRSRCGKSCCYLFWFVAFSSLAWLLSVIIIYFLDRPGSGPCKDFYPAKSDWVNTEIDRQFWPQVPQEPISPGLNIDGEPMDPSLRLNEIMTVGHHNSYHMQNPDLTIAIWNRLIKVWHYTHLPFQEQTDLGIRVFQMDLHQRDDGIMNYHLHLQDMVTRCYCVTTCLSELKQWSLNNPDHTTIFVLLGYKLTVVEDPYPQLTYNDLMALEQHILSVWNESSILTPDMVRGDHDTLGDAIRSDGWPYASSVSGRAVFIFWNRGDDNRELYLRNSPNHEGRVMFAVSTQPRSDVAILRLDPYYQGSQIIKDSVTLGFIVGSRADHVEHRDQDDIRLRNTFEGGAQLAYMDFGLGQKWHSIPQHFRNRTVPVDPDHDQ